MTQYNLKSPASSSFAWQEAKEKRRKQLTAVRARRREIYKRFTERHASKLRK